MHALARDIRSDTAAMFAPPELISVSEGIAKSLVTATGAYEPGLTPYMSGPADALDSRRYRTVVFVGPGRTGKTVTLIDGWMARNVVHAPGDMLIVQASQDLARYYSKIRIKRTIEASPDLRARLSPRRQDDNTFDKMWRSGMVTSFGWPSGAQLSGRDFRYVALTEYDLAADDIEGEGSLYALALKRTETFLSAGKVVVESSVRREYRDAKWERGPGTHEAPPATGITALYNSGTRCWFYWRCESCGEWMGLNPDIHVMFDLPPLEQLAEELPNEDAHKWAGAHALIPCKACGTAIRENRKAALNRGGIWVPEGCTVSGDGQVSGEQRQTDIASFHIGSVAAAYQSWTSLLKSYAVAIQGYARSGDEVEIKSTVNLDQGRAYLPLSVGKARSAHELQERIDENWEQQTVPHGVRFLTAQVDVQAGKRAGFVVQVHGIGEGNQKWIVDRYALRSSRRSDGNGGWLPMDPASFVEDWDRLIDKVIQRRYPLGDGSGRSMPVRVVGCDSGGADGVTTRAYEFWRKLKLERMGHRFRLLKGMESKAAPRVHESFPDSRGRKDRKAGAAGDVPVLMINTTLVKDALMANVWRSTPGPGFYHFPKWLQTSFFEELTAEVRGAERWEAPPGKWNESLDLCVYGEALLIWMKADKINWAAPPPWAELWDKNPDVIVFDPAKAAEPIQPRAPLRVHSNYLNRNR